MQPSRTSSSLRSTGPAPPLDITTDTPGFLLSIVYSRGAAFSRMSVLLFLGALGRLQHRLPEHVASLLHRSLTHSVQRRTKPRASRHLRRTSFVKGEIETPVSWANGKRSPVGPF